MDFIPCKLMFFHIQEMCHNTNYLCNDEWTFRCKQLNKKDINHQIISIQLSKLQFKKTIRLLISFHI